MSDIYEFSRDDAGRFADYMRAECHIKGDELMFRYCPMCGGGTGHKKDKDTFSINLRTGQCACLRSKCSYKGNMITLARDTGFDLGRDVSAHYNINNFNGQFKKFKDAHRETSDAAIEYLKSRGIPEEVARRYEITTKKDDNNILVFPFKDDSGKLRFIKYRNMSFVKGETFGSKEWCESGCMPILFGMAQCHKDNRRLIITEGQIDSLSVAAAGFENALSVPTGKNGFTWVGHCWSFMENFDTLLIFGDKEPDGMTLLEDLKRKFSKKKISYVRAEDYKDCKDANEILQKYGVEQVKKCIRNAVEVPVNGLVDLSEIKPLNRYDVEKLPTGLERVDKMLCGGLPFGGVTDITGKTGEGKSTLASQIIASAVEHNYKCFVYSGELDASLFKEGIDRQIAGARVIETKEDGWTAYSIPDDVQKSINNWYKGKCFFYDSFSLAIDNSDQEQTTLVEKMEEAAQRYDIRVFLIDNLMTALDLELMENKDKYEKQSLFMKRLVALAIKHNLLIMLVAHNRKDGSGTTSDNISGTADIGNLATVTIDYTKTKLTNGKGERLRERDVDGVEMRTDQRLLRIGKNRLFANVNLEGWGTEYDIRSNRIFMTIDEKDKEYDLGDIEQTLAPVEDWEIPF